MVNGRVFLLFSSACAAAAPAARMPSIIFILSDDLGFGDYEISEPVRPQGGQGRIRTPNIVRLSNNGMRFLQSYSGPICAPSRTVLMTGKHMGHTTIRGSITEKYQRQHLPTHSCTNLFTPSTPHPPID